MITVEHLEELLRAEQPDACLVLVEGEASVVDQTAKKRAGALELLSRADLEDRLGTDEPSRERLQEVAAVLDAIAAGRGA